ncbi:glycerate kinase [Marinobacter salinexigens]|uniref:Glycerate kinase n=1 Tax=Marinobacter salinexigens TaxID=2919747 RepID=A0A5B0VP10_9GAMM|nr:glycerate kinase [Marinobacter salinexigens]KAA1176124.1 glycerate kinase [Marinobacter salinexigens]
MKIVVAPDSFKECLDAGAVASAIATGWKRGAPDDEVVEVPLADGGEGSTVALVESQGGTLHTVEVTGPLGAMVWACYGLVDGGKTAIVEVAEGSGLHLVPANGRDALAATSRGTGELINAAIAHGPERLVLCLGGSATTDGGAGILQALGARLLDEDGGDVPPGGVGLEKLVSMDAAPALARLAGIELVAACDVTNPLLGDRGAAAVFGPQKGATPDMVKRLDRALSRMSSVATGSGFDMHSFAGSGAAGGIGGMLGGILGAGLKAGIELIMETVGLEAHIREADLVITAEGAIDSQSAHGKTPAGVSALAARHGVPVIGLGGRVGAELSPLYEVGLTAAFSVVHGPSTLEQAIAEGKDNLEQAAEQLARVVAAFSRSH